MSVAFVVQYDSNVGYVVEKVTREIVFVTGDSRVAQRHADELARSCTSQSCEEHPHGIDPVGPN